MPITIRPIAQQDNPAVYDLVIETLTEFRCVGEGFASNDPELKMMYEFYRQPGSAYYVLWDEEQQTILGGGGYARLKGTTEEENICELQKLYFNPAARGLGLGRKLMTHIVEEAGELGYQQMYLETQPQMLSAISMYEKFGFMHLPAPMGDTGHSACHVFMVRNLQHAQTTTGICGS